MTRTLARLAPPVLLVAALSLTGCSSDGSDANSDGSSAGDAPAVSEPEGRGLADDDAGGGVDDGTTSDQSGAEPATGPATGPATKQVDAANLRVLQRAVIRTGDVSFRADDVGRAQFEVRRIVDRAAGEVTEEQTESGKDGRPAYSRMVLRVPTDAFARSVEALKAVGEDPTVNTTEDEVTTKLIDVRTRLAAQERSIARITVLFNQAESIRDIMAIESELSRRQADLDALERKRAYLTGQSAMSTITVNVERTPEKKPAPTKDDDTGFLAGLSAGWDTLTAFGVGLATVAGAVLPWLAVVAVVGVPVLLLVRSARRRTPSVEPAEAAQSSE